jgi:hypothetical protein
MPEHDRIDELVANTPGDIKQLFSRDRYKTLSVLIVLVMVGMAGCELVNPPQLQSPFTGEKATQQQIAAQAEAYQLDLVSRAEAMRIEYEARQNALKAEAEKKGVALKSVDAEFKQRHERNVGIFNALGGLVGSIPGYGQVALGILSLGSLVYAGGAKADQMRAGSIIANRPLTSPAVRTGEPEPPA